MSNKPKILVVDDEVPVCNSIRSALEIDDYIVEMALSGEEAIKKETETKYDVIITDIMMPGMSGMDLLKEVKQKWPDVVVIMITGFPSIKTAVQSIKIGAFDYIPKPFTPNDLRGLVKRGLNRRTYVDKKETAVKEQEVKPERRISTPEGLYCIPEHSWAKVEEDDRVRVGAHHIFLTTIRDIESIEFPAVNSAISQGDMCIRIRSAYKNIYRMWSPVSGIIKSIHDSLKSSILKLMHDPYGDGWMLVIDPSNLKSDLYNLIRT